MKEEFFKPSVTVDTIIFTVRDLNVDNYRKLPEKKFQVLLVKRAGEPYKDKWSLPGTFVGKEERFEEAVNRCLGWFKKFFFHFYLQMEVGGWKLEVGNMGNFLEEIT